MDKSKKPVINTDSLSRLYSQIAGLGTPEHDPLLNLSINPPPKYTKQELIAAYRHIWLCRKVCDYIPTMMAREWGEIRLENSRELEQKLKRSLTKLKTIYMKGQQQANLFGGSLVIRFIDDGQELNQPVNFNNLNNTKITYSRIYSPWEVYPKLDRDYSYSSNPSLYEFAYVYTEQEQQQQDLSVQEVHSDRILRFRGSDVDEETLRNNRGFEDSLLIPFLEPCLRYLSAIAYVGGTVKSFEFIVHYLDNLYTELEDAEGQQHLAERLQVAYKSVGALRGLIAQKDEEVIEIVSRSYTGVKDILEVLLNDAIASSGLTRPQLIQEHPSGLAATGESERLAEADVIRARQSEKWEEQIEADCRLHLACIGYLGEDWVWQWSSLFQQTPLEEAETLLKQSAIDTTYLAAGVLSVEEIRARRLLDQP